MNKILFYFKISYISFDHNKFEILNNKLLYKNFLNEYILIVVVIIIIIIHLNCNWKIIKLKLAEIMDVHEGTTWKVY